MIYASDRLRHDGDITYGEHRKDGDSTLRLTVPEAAGVMGISAEAVRQRIKRRTLPTEKDASGTVLVLLDEALVADSTRQYAHGTRKDGDITGDSTPLTESLQEQVEYLKETVAKRDEEIRRRDHLLAAALERIPAIQESTEVREGPVPGEVEQGEPFRERRSWWQRWFGV